MPNAASASPAPTSSKPAALVDAARGLELPLRPERQLAVADRAGEADALLDQLRADLPAARRGVDDQQAQLRDAVARVDAEDRADGLAVAARRSSSARAPGRECCEIGGHDLRDERLEAGVEAVLAGVQRTVALDDPAVLARERALGSRAIAPERVVAEQLLDRRHGGEQAPLGIRGQALEQRRRPGRPSGGRARRTRPGPVRASEMQLARGRRRASACARRGRRPRGAASTRLRWPGSSSSDWTSAEAVVSGTCPSS